MSSMLYLNSCLVSLSDLKLTSELVSGNVMYPLWHTCVYGTVNLCCYLYFMLIFLCKEMLILFIGFAKFMDETWGLQLTIGGDSYCEQFHLIVVWI